MLTDDAFYSLRVAYRSTLFNQIVVNGVTVPVYAATKQILSTAKMYILIQLQSSAGSNTKVTTESSTLVQLSLFARGAEMTGNEIEDMGSQVLALIEPTPGFTIAINENFQNISQRIITDQVMPVVMGNTIDPTYERNIIIQHQIKHHKRSII